MPKPRIDRPKKARMIEEKQAMPAEVGWFCFVFRMLLFKTPKVKIAINIMYMQCGHLFEALGAGVRFCHPYVIM